MKARLSLLAISLIVSLAVCELGIRTLTPLPITRQSNRIPDDMLGYRLDPKLRDVDSDGFRNPEREGQVDIIAIGDSHTYGNNVEWHQAWPHQVSTLLDRSAYNMGVGSYGVYQYYALMHLAMQLEPSDVIVGLYPTNDLQGLAGCAIMAAPEWKELMPSSDLETGMCEDRVEPQPASGRARTVSGLVRWAGEHSALVGLFDVGLGRALTAPPAYLIARDEHEIPVTKAVVQDHARTTSLASSVYRASFQNSLTLFVGMAELAASHGVRLSVLFVPSKERVLQRWADRGRGIVPAPVRTAVAQEEELVRRYRSFFDELGIDVADPTEALASMVEDITRQGGQAYPVRDGHPLAEGYRAYAEVAAELVR